MASLFLNPLVEVSEISNKVSLHNTCLQTVTENNSIFLFPNLNKKVKVYSSTPTSKKGNFDMGMDTHFFCRSA